MWLGNLKLVNMSRKSGLLSAVMKLGVISFPMNAWVVEQAPACVENFFASDLCVRYSISVPCNVLNLWFPSGLPLQSNWVGAFCSSSRCISHLYKGGCYIWKAHRILGCHKTGAVLPRQHVQKRASFVAFLSSYASHYKCILNFTTVHNLSVLYAWNKITRALSLH